MLHPVPIIFKSIIELFFFHFRATHSAIPKRMYNEQRKRGAKLILNIIDGEKKEDCLPRYIWLRVNVCREVTVV